MQIFNPKVVTILKPEADVSIFSGKTAPPRIYSQGRPPLIALLRIK